MALKALIGIVMIGSVVYLAMPNTVSAIHNRAGAAEPMDSAGLNKIQIKVVYLTPCIPTATNKKTCSRTGFFKDSKMSKDTEIKVYANVNDANPKINKKAKGGKRDLTVTLLRGDKITREWRRAVMGQRKQKIKFCYKKFGKANSCKRIELDAAKGDMFPDHHKYMYTLYYIWKFGKFEMKQIARKDFL